MSDKHPLTQKEFDHIYSKVPRLTIEIIIKNNRGEIYLSRRNVNHGITAACNGLWHLPGGTVRFGERLTDAVIRIAKRELGVSVTSPELKGYIEYPSHFDHNMDSPVGIVFEVISWEGDFMLNKESEESGWFDTIPTNFHADQDKYLLVHKYLKSIDLTDTTYSSSI
jgi:ADP-ribose pyrophosphatase YjhB (NUDIX family)